MKRGLVSITFRQKSHEELIEIVKKAGLEVIEWGGDVHVPHGDIETAERVGKLTRDAGLEVAAYGSYYNATDKGVLLGPVATFDEILETAVALGTDTIRVWAGNKNFYSDDPEVPVATEEERKIFYERLSEAVEKAAARGITLATEYHQNTLTNTLEGALDVLENVPGLKTYWQARLDGVTDEVGNIKALGKNIVNSHIEYRANKVKLPLADGLELVTDCVNALREYSDAKAGMIEFVVDGKDEQFLEDAEVLKSILPYEECRCVECADAQCMDECLEECLENAECGDECCSCGHKKSKILKLILAIGIPFVAIIAAVAICFYMGVFKSPAVKLVDKFYNDIVAGNGAEIYKNTTDPYEVKSILAQGEFKTAADIEALYVDQYNQVKEMLKEQFGENITVTTRVDEITKYKKSDVKIVSQHLEKNFKYNADALEEIILVESEQTIKGDNDKTDQDSDDLIVKLEGKWYFGGVGDVIDEDTLEAILKGEK